MKKLATILTVATLLCFVLQNTGKAETSAALRPSIDSVAKEFLRDAPKKNADALVKYSEGFYHKYATAFDGKQLSPYCRALQLHPKKALEIMDVYFGGAADARLPTCFELQLDAKLPEVKKWVEALRKEAPKMEGSIRQPLIRAAWFSLLRAAVFPNPVSEYDVKSGDKYSHGFPTRSAEFMKTHANAKVAIIAYYRSKFGFDEAKAKELAEKHMTIIAWRNGRLKF
jgi:hypothetical protein